MNRTAQTDVWKGLAAGAIAGAAGAWAMTQLHVSLYGRGVTGSREPQSHRPVDQPDQDAAMKAAAQVVSLADYTLTQRQKRQGAVIVHYIFGASLGALYGAIAARWPRARWGAGLPFGALVWAIADEAALPALGLAHGPAAYPTSVHAEMLAAHLLFGSATDAALTTVYRGLGNDG